MDSVREVLEMSTFQSTRILMLDFFTRKKSCNRIFIDYHQKMVAREFLKPPLV